MCLINALPVSTKCCLVYSHSVSALYSSVGKTADTILHCSSVQCLKEMAVHSAGDFPLTSSPPSGVCVRARACVCVCSPCRVYVSGMRVSRVNEKRGEIEKCECGGHEC